MNPGHKKKLTPEQERQLLQWAAFGTSKQQVRNRLGIGQHALLKYLRKTHVSTQIAAIKETA
jgi:DNA-binding CsgD family transcriptional regulator